MNRHLPASQSATGWRCEQYANQRALPAHLSTKFVPMQVRTQPANLPQGLRRALSNVKVTDSSKFNVIRIVSLR